MGQIRIRFAAAVLLLSLASTARPNDLASVKQALESKYALTTTTADKTDIVTAGSVLVLKKTGLFTNDVTGKIVYTNAYRNGRIDQTGTAKAVKWAEKFPGYTPVCADRTFVSGEKVWITNIEVKEKEVVLTLFTDAFNNTRYESTLAFSFKNITPTAAGVTSAVAEVFDIQPSDDKEKGQQQPSPGASDAKEVSPPAPAPTAAPAPIPPPPADPKTISLGQTPDQVTANFGQPDNKIKLGAKEIYVYKNMKVTFVAGKVTDAQ